MSDHSGLFAQDNQDDTMDLRPTKRTKDYVEDSEGHSDSSLTQYESTAGLSRHTPSPPAVVSSKHAIRDEFGRFKKTPAKERGASEMPSTKTKRKESSENSKPVASKRPKLDILDDRAKEAIRVMNEAEAFFKSADQVKQRNITEPVWDDAKGRWSGAAFDPNQDYSEWYIKPAEHGPKPFRTLRDYMAYYDKREIRDNLIVEQMRRHNVLHHDGLFLADTFGTQLGWADARAEKMQYLLDRYEYEDSEVSDEGGEQDDEADSRSKRRSNRFTEFMKKRQKILED